MDQVCLGGGISSPTALPQFPLQLRDPLASGRKMSADSTSEISATTHSVLSWNFDDIRDWLRKLNLFEYVEAFEIHAITNGKILLQLTQENLKDIGINRVGHRVVVSNALDEMRNLVGMVPMAPHFCDINFIAL